MEPLYLTPPPEVIIILLLIVSMGEDIRPAVTVTAHPRRKEAATEESFPPISRGFRVSKSPKYMPRLQQLVLNVSAPSARLRCLTRRHTSSILKANTPNHLCQRNSRTSRHSLNGLFFVSCYATK